MANRLDTTSTVTLILNGEQSKTTLREVTQAINATTSALRNMRESDNPQLYRDRIRELGRLREAQAAMRQEINGGTEAQKGFFKTFLEGFSQIRDLTSGVALGTLLANGVTKGIGMLKDFGMAVIDTYKEFEKFDAVLTNTLGDKGSSRRALNMLQQFAAETPFQLAELTESYVKLVNRGIHPTTEELKQMGDLAASQGKSFDQLTEAVLDATTGEFERLKEFGIRGSKNGDMVSLSFKGITKEVKNSEEAIQSAILSFGAMEGVAGGMEKISKTVGGGLSNMSDNWDRLLTTIGSNTGGMIYSAVSQINTYLNFLVEAFKSTEQRIQEVADDYAADALKRYNQKTKAEQTAIYEGSKLEIKYYEDQIAKEQKKLEDLRKKRGTGEQREQAERNIHDLQLNLTKEKTFVEAVDADTKQREETERKKADEDKRKADAEAKKQREKEAKEFEAKKGKYFSDVESVKSEYLALAAKAQEGSVDDLDAQLKVVDDKYNKLVAKLKKLAADPHVTKALAKEFASDIDSITKPGGLKEGAEENVKDDFAKKQAKVRQENDAKNRKESKAWQTSLEGGINAGFDKEADGLDIQQSDELMLATSEEAQINIKTKYDELFIQLEQRRLQTLIELRKSYGKDTTDLDKKFARTEVETAQSKAAQKAKIQEQEFQLARTLTNGIGSLIEITMGNSEIGIVMQKTVAIAQIAIDTAQAISAATKSGAMVGLTPFEKALAIAGNIAVVLAGIAKAKAVLTDVSDVKAGKVKKAAKGALIPDGPSHDQGGINLVNNQTGDVIAEMEGGEPILILSKETRRNNGMLINELLFNSQYRNGAPVRINTDLATRPATTMLKQGGILPTPSDGAGAGVSPVVFPMNPDYINELQAMRKAMEDFSKKPWEFPMRAFQEATFRIEEITNQAKGK